MSEPISDEDLRNLRLFAKDPDNAFYCHVDSDTLAEIIARLDAAEAKLVKIAELMATKSYAVLPLLVDGLLARFDAAEAKLERIKQIVDPNQYSSLSMLVEIKKIIYG